MNIEIANRLVNLRKENSLSQEALAEKLGISRQAVSKWERAEASPDTDNLILLAKLYGVSLDELLKTEDEIPMQIQEEQPEVIRQTADTEAVSEEKGFEENENAKAADTFEKADFEENTTRTGQEDEYVHIGLEGVHVKDKDGSEVHVGWDGIHVDDTKKGDSVHVDKNGVYVNGKKYESPWFGVWRFPFSACMVLLFIISGVVFNAWHPAWMLFLLIPIWESFVSAVKHRNAHIFAYPVLTAFLYLCGGFFLHTWHPGWVIFLTIPLYYPLVAYLQRGIRESTYDCSTGCYGSNEVE